MEGICTIVLRNKGYIKQKLLSRISPYILGIRIEEEIKSLSKTPILKKDGDMDGWVQWQSHGLTILGNRAGGICLSGIGKMLKIKQWSETSK